MQLPTRQKSMASLLRTLNEQPDTLANRLAAIFQMQDLALGSPLPRLDPFRPQHLPLVTWALLDLDLVLRLIARLAQLVMLERLVRCRRQAN